VKKSELSDETQSGFDFKRILNNACLRLTHGKRTKRTHVKLTITVDKLVALVAFIDWA
jgi:hypothetical protein